MKQIYYPDYLELYPAQVKGIVKLPGSKSISNRILLLASLSNGKTKIINLLVSDDTLTMLVALKTLGVKWRKYSNNNIKNYIINGINGVFPVCKANLFMGNAGTVIRPLTGILAVLGGNYILHGMPRMHERPIGDLVNTLNAAGMRIEYLQKNGYPPLHIHNGTLNTYCLKVHGEMSSQFLTALLMAAPLMAKNHDITIDIIGELISKPYILITLNIMKRFGITVYENNLQTFCIPAGQNYLAPGTIHVEGDASSASYFLAAGAISGGPIKVEGVGQHSIQGDIQFIDVLRKMGATVTLGNNWIEASSDGVLRAINADFNHLPDAAMTIAMLALYANGTSILRNIISWRVKESDRLTAMATELRKLGAIIEEGLDYLSITPPEKIESATIETYDDHRIAMCFSLATLNGIKKQGGYIRINNPKCVAKTFPNYFEVFKKIIQ